MIDHLQIFCAGLAALIDSVLLLTLIEKRNLRRTPFPALVIVVAVWLFHTGGFVHGLVQDTSSDFSRTIHWASMSTMAVGLVLMPLAMIHLVARIMHTGLAPWPRRDPRYLLLYLPMMVVVFAERRIASHPEGWFVDLVAPMVVPYVAFVTTVSVLVAMAALWVRRRTKIPRDRALFAGLALAMLSMAGLFVGILLYGIHSPSTVFLYLQLLAFLAPLVPVLIFGYFVIRFNFLRIVVERTTLYATLILIVLFIHWLLYVSIAKKLSDSIRMDLGILEGIVLVGVILLIQPVRERVAEAISYALRNEPASRLRERIRQLSLQLAQRTDEDPDSLLAWFCRESPEHLGVSYIDAWRWRNGDLVASFLNDKSPPRDEAERLWAELTRESTGFVAPRDCATHRSIETLESRRSSGAIVLKHESIQGLLVFGPRRRRVHFGDEEANALSLLTEQLASAMHARTIEQARRLAQEKALLNEKLSVFGLVAGSLVHEIKNPLSSIKTIATVLAEDLGPQSPHVRDVEIMLGEIRRLTEATGDILHFVRPSSSAESAYPAKVARTVVHIVKHLAAQKKISLEVNFDQESEKVKMRSSDLQEVFFNLISNALEAVGADGWVRIKGRVEGERFIGEVADSGPGIDDDRRDQIFEPFVTTKEHGTGLGLATVRRHLQSAGGEIEAGNVGGAVFRFWIPLETSP